jgi:hypothetical protein
VVVSVVPLRLVMQGLAEREEATRTMCRVPLTVWSGMKSGGLVMTLDNTSISNLNFTFFPASYNVGSVRIIHLIKSGFRTWGKVVEGGL